MQFQNYPYPPRRALFLNSPPPWNFHFRRCLPYPPPPVISLIFHLGWIPPGKNTFLKNAVALYFYVIDNCFCDREKTADISLHQPTLFLQNDVWETSAEIPYWWRVTTQIWVVLLTGWNKFPIRHNQSEVLPTSG